MMPPRPIGVGLGAAALTTSALLFAVFPLVRPFFRLDVFSPALADVASGPLASPPWVASHLLLTAAFALLPLGLLAIATALVETPAARQAQRGMILGVVGIGLVLPAVGVETYAMPVLGRLYLDGVTGLAPALAWIYRGPMTLVMLVGLLLLALGAVDLARAVWRSDVLPRTGAVALAAGLALWLPLLPRPVRIADGLLIGLGGVRLGWALWRKGRAGAATGNPITAPADPGVEAYRTL
jgi:hypothetical protein